MRTLNSDLCYVCHKKEKKYTPVLWKELIDAWGLNQVEELYINRQQGEACSNCGCNLRSIAQAKAILDALGSADSLITASKRRKFRKLKILEINEAGNLSKFLVGFPKHNLLSYPAIDIQDLGSFYESFDIVLHGDTLEHVPDPQKALEECYKALRTGGTLIFTVPLVVGRLTKSRKNLAPSYHGNPEMNSNDYLVHSEFGSDIWEHVLRAGFENVTIHSYEFPAALAISAKK